MQLKVIKADGSIEDYLHTKVIGAINHALAGAGEADMSTIERLAEVVTYYLYQQRARPYVTSNEIFSIIKVVLTSTGYESAALELSRYHFERQVKRRRIKVVIVDINELSDAKRFVCDREQLVNMQWDKSIIVKKLVTGHGICRQNARMIASMVEEKVLVMGISIISTSLIRQFVLHYTASVSRAQEQL